MMSFDDLPWDIKYIIFCFLAHEFPQPYPPHLESELGRHFTRLACVNRQWQEFFERFNFRTLGITGESLPQLTSYVWPERSNLVTRIHLHVWLPVGNPQSEVDAQANSTEFTRVVHEFFRTVERWPGHGRLGFVLSVAVRPSMVSDKIFFTARSYPTWNRAPIVHRLVHECSREGKLTLLKVGIDATPLPRLQAVGTFGVHRPLWGNCGIKHQALSRILGSLPWAKEVDIDVGKAFWINPTPAELDELGTAMPGWSRLLTKLKLRHTITQPYRVEGVARDSLATRRLGHSLRQFASQRIQHLEVCNFLTVESFMGELWPGKESPVAITPISELGETIELMTYQHLETLHFGSSIMSRERITHYLMPGKYQELHLYCQCIMLGAARLALSMPHLREMVIVQHFPAGRFVRITYRVVPSGTELAWQATEHLTPWRQTFQAWSLAATKHSKRPLRMFPYGLQQTAADMDLQNAPTGLPYNIGVGA